jgi:rhodanese-related sulfurtransferase
MLVIMTLSSCVINAGIKATSRTVTNISAAKAKEMIGDGELLDGEAFILLDVRTEEEFNEIHINDAILIPDYEIRERALVELPDKDMPIIVYCRRGFRSAFAANDLLEMGYTNVYNLGGILDWPYETVSGFE